MRAGALQGMATYLAFLAPLVSTGIGGCGVVQVGLNGALARQLGHFLPSALVSYAGGMLWIGLANALLWWRVGGLETAPRRRRSGWPQWWECCGGALGSLGLVGSVAVAPHLSFTLITMINSLGQMLASLTVDHYGFLGMPRHRLTWQRVGGALIVVAGCILAGLYLGSPGGAAAGGSSSILSTLAYSLVYLTTRSLQPVQACINGRLSEHLPSPAGPLAGMVSFSTGAIAVSLMCAALFVRRPKYYHLTAAALTRPWAADGVKWWMLLGGIPGSTGTITTVFLTKHLSATVHNTLTAAGSLFGSMVFDSLGSFGAAKRPTTWLRLVSVALAFAGSALTKEPFGRPRESKQDPNV